MSEPNAGSDLAVADARGPSARDDHFVVNGQKVWTSGAHDADYCLCLRAHRSRGAEAPRASACSSSTCARPASRAGRCPS